MSTRPCILIGVPVQEGTGILGCDMGPSAFRAAGLAGALNGLGFEVIDRGNLSPVAKRDITHSNPAIKSLPEIVAWTEAVSPVRLRMTCSTVVPRTFARNSSFVWTSTWPGTVASARFG